MNLDQLEQEFDRVYKEHADYVMSAWRDGAILLGIPQTVENQAQLLRLYKKLTWLMVYPRNYDDGLWETF